MFKGSYAVLGGTGASLPVDLTISGCPPDPRAIARRPAGAAGGQHEVAGRPEPNRAAACRVRAPIHPVATVISCPRPHRHRYRSSWPAKGLTYATPRRIAVLSVGRKRAAPSAPPEAEGATRFRPTLSVCPGTIELACHCERREAISRVTSSCSSRGRLLRGARKKQRPPPPLEGGGRPFLRRTTRSVSYRARRRRPVVNSQ